MSATNEYGTIKDFEVIWLDRFSHLPLDMNNVNFEIYHYENKSEGILTAPAREPYYVTMGINDRVNIGSVNVDTGITIDVDFILQLNLIPSQLAGLGCLPNNYVVPNTVQKVAVVSTHLVYALSACELAALINLDASGYTAHSEDGYLVLKSTNVGAANYLEVGNGSINSVLQLVQGTRYFGFDTRRVDDIVATPMTHLSTGVYVYTGVELIEPIFIVGKRYYAFCRGTHPTRGTPELYEENFVIINPIPTQSSTTFSFL